MGNLDDFRAEADARRKVLARAELPRVLLWTLLTLVLASAVWQRCGFGPATSRELQRKARAAPRPRQLEMEREQAAAPATTTKYLLPALMFGPTNQLFGLVEAALLANATGRVLVAPFFIPQPNDRLPTFLHDSPRAVVGIDEVLDLSALNAVTRTVSAREWIRRTARPPPTPAPASEGGTGGEAEACASAQWVHVGVRGESWQAVSARPNGAAVWGRRSVENFARRAVQSTGFGRLCVGPPELPRWATTYADVAGFLESVRNETVMVASLFSQVRHHPRLERNGDALRARLFRCAFRRRPFIRQSVDAFQLRQSEGWRQCHADRWIAVHWRRPDGRFAATGQSPDEGLDASGRPLPHTDWSRHAQVLLDIKRRHGSSPGACLYLMTNQLTEADRAEFWRPAFASWLVLVSDVDRLSSVYALHFDMDMAERAAVFIMTPSSSVSQFVADVRKMRGLPSYALSDSVGTAPLAPAPDPLWHRPLPAVVVGSAHGEDHC